MRSIGQRNKKLIRKVFEKLTVRTPWGEVETPTTQKVIDELPVGLWDTWEGADSEIRNIIQDIRMGRNKLKKVM